MKEPLRFLKCPFSGDLCLRNGVLDAVGGYEVGAVSRLFDVSGGPDGDAWFRRELNRSFEGALDSFSLFMAASRSRSSRTPPMKAGLLATVWTDSTGPGRGDRSRGSGLLVRDCGFTGAWSGGCLSSELVRPSKGADMIRGFNPGRLSIAAGGGSLVSLLFADLAAPSLSFLLFP